jgi:hypothetical protein
VVSKAIIFYNCTLADLAEIKKDLAAVVQRHSLGSIYAAESIL